MGVTNCGVKPLTQHSVNDRAILPDVELDIGTGSSSKNTECLIKARSETLGN